MQRKITWHIIGVGLNRSFYYHENECKHHWKTFASCSRALFQKVARLLPCTPSTEMFFSGRSFEKLLKMFSDVFSDVFLDVLRCVCRCAFRYCSMFLDAFLDIFLDVFMLLNGILENFPGSDFWELKVHTLTENGGPRADFETPGKSRNHSKSDFWL